MSDQLFGQDPPTEDRLPEPPPPEGDDWDFEDEEQMRRRFPRLCHLYLIPQEDGGE